MINLSGKISDLYRHPIKGFSPEVVSEVLLAKDGFFPFDRIYAFEVGRSGYHAQDPQFLSKMKYAVLARFSCLAALKTRYDEIDNRFYIQDQGFDLSAVAGRASLCRHIETYLQAHEDYDPIAAPLTLLDIKETELERFRFTDSAKGFVSLLNLNSVRDLEQRTGLEIDPLRFRANIWFEDMGAFEDHDWVGRQIKLSEDGPVLEGLKPIKRCVATHVDPQGAQKNIDICASLFQHYGHMDLGLYCRVVEGGRVDASTNPI